MTDSGLQDFTRVYQFENGTLRLNIPPLFYSKLGVKDTDVFALHWEPSGDELCLTRRTRKSEEVSVPKEFLQAFGFSASDVSGYTEYDTDWTVWLQLQDLNPDVDFGKFGSSEEETELFLLHLGGGVWEVLKPTDVYKRLLEGI